MAATHSPPDDLPPARPEYEEPVEAEEQAPTESDGGEGPPTPSATLPPISDPDGELEELEDRSMPVTRVLWAEHKGEIKKEAFVQKGLSWFGKLELYGLLGQAVKVVLEGDNPLGVSSLVDLTQNPRQMIADMMGDLPGADTAPDRPDDSADMDIEAGKIMAAFAQVVSLAPDLLAQAYCIALAVPKTHRNWAINWAFPNMDDEMGKDILHVFIDQNWGVMEDFFVKELPKIVKRIVKARKASAGRR